MASTNQQVGAMTTGAGFLTFYLTLTGLVRLQTEQSGWCSLPARCSGPRRQPQE